MIGSLRGVVVEVRSEGDSAAELTVEVGGVGYRVLVTPRTASRCAPGQSEVLLSVHTHVREGAITLYGFASVDERSAFELLLGAHGVGPGLALGILAVHSPSSLAAAVLGRDLNAFKLVPGVGQKTAARLVLELEARVDELSLSDLGLDPVPGGISTSPSTAEVREALGELGYGPEEIRGAVGALPDSGSVEELLRLALRSLVAKR